MITVWLRLTDAGTENECWVVCAKGDKDAIAFTPTSEDHERSGDASGSYMGTGSAYWNRDLEGR